MMIGAMFKGEATICTNQDKLSADEILFVGGRSQSNFLSASIPSLLYLLRRNSFISFNGKRVLSKK